MPDVAALAIVVGLIGAVLGAGVAFGSVAARLVTLEKRVDRQASTESVRLIDLRLADLSTSLEKRLDRIDRAIERTRDTDPGFRIPRSTASGEGEP